MCLNLRACLVAGKEIGKACNCGGHFFFQIETGCQNGENEKNKYEARKQQFSYTQQSPTEFLASCSELDWNSDQITVHHSFTLEICDCGPRSQRAWAIRVKNYYHTYIHHCKQVDPTECHQYPVAELGGSFDPRPHQNTSDFVPPHARVYSSP